MSFSATSALSRHRRRRLSRSATLIAAGFVATTGFSAVAAAASEDSPSEGGKGFTLEEVIVTAQKRSERLQDVPSSISVLGGERLDDLHATRLTDYAAYLPGFQVDTGGTPGKAQLVLRGVSTGSLSSTTVGAYVDDSPLGSSAGFSNQGAFSLDLMPYDLERVEVLRGPQGTLYGASTMGGLLKYVLRSADLDVVEGRVGVDASSIASGDDFGWGARASINMPLVEGRAAVRASYFRQRTPGYIDNAQNGTEDENEATQSGGRLALMWQASEDVTVKLSALLQDIDAENNSVVALNRTMVPINGDLTTAHRLDEPFEQRLQFYTATLNWNVGWADFTSASSYEKTHSENRIDFSDFYGPLMPVLCASDPACVAANGTITPGLAPFLMDIRLDKFTQEFRLASREGASLEWLVGAFYTDEDAEMDQLMRTLNTSGAPVPVLDPLFVLDQPSTFREYAGFGDVTFGLTERFDVTAGVRWAHNSQTFKQANSGPLVGGGATTLGQSSESVVTYMLSPRFRVSDATMVYGRVASGYRPGGPNSALPGVPPTVDADTLVNYEIGVKSEFLDRRAMIDVAVFYIDWQDIRITARTPGTNIGYGANGGTAKSQGAELTTTYSPIDGLRLGLNAAYTDATLTKDVPSLGGRSGDQLPFTPQWSGSFTLDYEFPVLSQWTGRLGGGYRYVAERWSAIESNPQAVESDAYHVVDLNAGLSNEQWTVRLFARNVTDERAYLTAQLQNPARVNAAVLQPRTVGLSVDVRF